MSKTVRPALRIGGIGLATVAALIAFSLVVGALAVGALLATGTLQHNSHGWTFRAGAADTKLSSEAYDPRTYSLLVQRGTGTQETASLTAAGPWSLTWAYDCPTNAGAISVVARSDQGVSYSAGTLSGTSHGAGQSNVLPAGSYALQIATGSQCTWSVGARPNH
ncbi:MAG TPA: hypothetical protein VHK65_13470 [Candidatus Dormibacteraeota bacterium]|nr:hypothetical protein [Candidatus Dormibacteraeota bacterium]